MDVRDSSNVMELTTNGARETMAVAGALAIALRSSGGGNFVILLEGPPGAGKTAFAKGFGKALGLDPDDVASPTFALAHVHALPSGKKLAHLDLYRLGDDGDPQSATKEFLEAGLDEFLGLDFALVEWADRLPPASYPEETVKVLIAPPKGLNMGPPAEGGEKPKEQVETEAGFSPEPPPPGTRGDSRLVTIRGAFPEESLMEKLKALPRGPGTGSEP